MKIFWLAGLVSLVLNATTYTISVVPQMPTEKIEATWRPFVETLSKETGLEFKLQHYKTIPEFEEGLKKGDPDFAFMNPYHEVLAYGWQKYNPLVHDHKNLVGILVVNKNSPIQNVAQLNGQKIVFPSPNAFAASLYMRALLEKEEHITFTPVYVKTHNNVYRNVMFGTAPAGGGVNNTLMRENDAVRASLRVLYTTKPLAPHPFCVNPKVDPKVAQLVKKTILNMGKYPQYAKILDAIQMPKPVEADYESEYAPLKKLDLASYLGDD